MAAPAAAQRSWEIAAGYSYLQDPPDRTNFPAGWLAGASASLTPWLSVVGDISRHHESSLDIDLSTTALLAGVRAGARIGPFVEFGQLLAGLARSTSTVVGMTTSANDPALQPGAAIEYPIARQFSLRAQFDYRVVRGGDGPGIADPRHQFRYSATLVYHGCCK